MRSCCPSCPRRSRKLRTCCCDDNWGSPQHSHCNSRRIPGTCFKKRQFNTEGLKKTQPSRSELTRVWIPLSLTNCKVCSNASVLWGTVSWSSRKLRTCCCDDNWGSPQHSHCNSRWIPGTCFKKRQFNTEGLKKTQPSRSELTRVWIPLSLTNCKVSMTRNSHQNGPEFGQTDVELGS